MSLAPTDYDFGDASNYFFATTITCANEEARAMYVEAFGHMLNYNHEQAIACFSKVTELDPTCAMAWWGVAYSIGPEYNRMWHQLDENELETALKECFEVTKLDLAKVAKSFGFAHPPKVELNIKHRTKKGKQNLKEVR